MPTTVALGTHFENFVKAQLESGRYNNVSEVVREGLRMLQDHEELRRMRLDVLRAEIQRGWPVVRQRLSTWRKSAPRVNACGRCAWPKDKAEDVDGLQAPASLC